MDRVSLAIRAHGVCNDTDAIIQIQRARGMRILINEGRIQLHKIEILRWCRKCVAVCLYSIRTGVLDLGRWRKEQFCVAPVLLRMANFLHSAR
ncbi:MAG: hypothetical protein DI604_22760 [Delftia acidovorans]|nr:MAG: hypothetical protein DI604_22760 [Delftia acidovorans]